MAMHCMARVIDVHSGHDSLVRVATIKTSNGVYKRRINKLALLLSSEEQQWTHMQVTVWNYML